MTGESLRVWLVDDDASIRWVLERALKHGGMSARVFDAAEPALEALRRESPDVLITDIRMPGASGLELLKRIRDARPALPVIVMTAHSDLGSAVSAYEGGAFEYLPKPFDIDQAVAFLVQSHQRFLDDRAIGERDRARLVAVGLAVDDEARRQARVHTLKVGKRTPHLADGGVQMQFFANGRHTRLSVLTARMCHSLTRLAGRIRTP